MKKISEFDWAVNILVAVGAINWGLVGVFKFDLIAVVFGTSPQLAQAVYALVGLSGCYFLYRILTMKK